MKFTTILRKIILEDTKYEILRAVTQPSTNREGKKIKPMMTIDEYNQLVAADPTTRLNNVDLQTADSKELTKVKAGSYVQWLIKNYLSPKTERTPEDRGYAQEVIQMKDRFMEDLNKFTNDLAKFDRFKARLPENSRDINKLTPDELYDLVKDFSLEKTKASADEKKEASQTYAHPGGKIVFRGGNWTVVKISDQTELGRDAACFYGGNQLYTIKGETNWCTSSPGYDGNFKRYIKDGPLYVIIPTQYEGKRGEVSGLPANRYQFHFPSNQFMDENDKQQDLVQFLNGPMSELKDFFKPEFAKGLTVGGDKLVIDSFNQGAIGKFIALYGLDELIDNLPDTLTEFTIQNNDNNNIIVHIPESISRLKKLETIMLRNCISEIPDSICELSNLRFIALMYNPKLTSIPDCIANLPKLLFVNLKGSNNVVVPESIKEKGEGYGEGLWEINQ
jgi:Leucine-rich repeat (LRR) protein